MKIWIKERTSIKKHLSNKFILSIEGNDVTSNLKWIMSSNSYCRISKIKKGNRHYLEIKDDYSDLEEKLEYLLSNPNIAKEIIKEANEFSSKFQNKYIEQPNINFSFRISFNLNFLNIILR